MPVTLNRPIKPISEQEFHSLDFQIMRLAFDAHNRLGRLYDEKIYQNKLIELCRKNGFKTASEVKIELRHKSFCKDLFIDLLIEDGAIYELKTAKTITSAHRVQTLDYLFLTDIRHGKIINFRTPFVEHEFVSTTLSQTDRRAVSVCDNNWDRTSEPASRLKTLIMDLLSDWGAFLNTEFYKEAVCFLLSNGDNIVEPVEIKSGTTVLGRQNTPLLSATESFYISSIRDDLSAFQTHLQRFLRHARPWKACLNHSAK